MIFLVIRTLAFGVGPFLFWKHELRKERERRATEQWLFKAVNFVSARDLEIRTNQAYLAGYEAGRAQ